MARDLTGLSAAEGACFVKGLSASGSTCTMGEATLWCSQGLAASITGNPAFCQAGPIAANCMNNGMTAGG